MSDWMREVDYATYCPKCVNFKVLETDEPCNERAKAVAGFLRILQ